MSLSYGLALIPQLWATCTVATLNQMYLLGPPKQLPPKLAPTEAQVQMKGVVLHTFICKPKKRYSSNCKCCCMQFSTGQEAICFTSGEGNSQQEHPVLVQGGHNQELPGVKLKVVNVSMTMPCAEVTARSIMSCCLCKIRTFVTGFLQYSWEARLVLEASDPGSNPESSPNSQ
ncbi:unnamed protein product [Pipistrellus nathusii]|uniref:Uncharacterized protein n=1 Tax=Pipistrellus nathusii TaxID=59473 RepID=A0ABN9ZTE4_PIPNA